MVARKTDRIIRIGKGAEEHRPLPGENAGVEQREQHAFDAVGVFAHVFKKENAAF